MTTLKTAKSFNLRKDKNAKLKVLLALYGAMVSYTQELRGAVERITIWGSGLLLLIDGWLVTGAKPVGLTAKEIISAGILAFAGILLWIVFSLQQRFNGFAYIIRRLNEVQLVYEPGAFIKGELLFPPEWKAFGTEQWREPIFRVAYVSLSLVAAFAATVVWIV